MSADSRLRSPISKRGWWPTEVTDKEALDEAKRRYLAAEADIERLRTKIALAACPVKVGDRVTVDDGDKVYDGRVDYIGHYCGSDEILGPVIGAPTGWAAGGFRYNKGTGEVGKWSFAISSNDELKDGVWHFVPREFINGP